MAALCCAPTARATPQEARSAQLVTQREPAAAEGFDPAQSAALFVGVRVFTHDASLTEVRYAADDAVDLAYTLALGRDVPLVKPRRVMLALSGEPQKPESLQRLEELKRAGAEVRPAGQSDLLELLELQSRRVGRKGIFIVGIATHAYVAEGELHLLASSSMLRHHETSLTATTLFDIVAASDAPRSLIFIDACRERMSNDKRGVSEARDVTQLFKAVAQSTGQVVFYGAAPGCYAYDDEERRNGVFTGALLDGLGCAATGEHGLITVDALADFVNERVLGWLKTHRDRHATKGIQVTIDRGSRGMALGICGATAEPNKVVKTLLNAVRDLVAIVQAAESSDP